MKTHLTMLMVSLCLLIACSFAVWADEDVSFSRSDMPAEVLAAFAKAHPDVTPSGYDIDEDEGQKQYEIETKPGRYEMDYIYLADGTQIQTEEQIAMKTLPTVVVDAARKAHPMCEMDEAERIVRGSDIEYEVVVEVGEDAEFELLISANGDVLYSAAKADEDDDHEADADEDQDHMEDDD